jgi:hypothetical protein
MQLWLCGKRLSPPCVVNPLKLVQNFLGLELWEVFERRDEVRNHDVDL